MNTEFTKNYLVETECVLRNLNVHDIDSCISKLIELKIRRGRLFILGVGGSAANASHAVNDFRKICGIEAYSPTDNVSELTARTNDEGWQTVFVEWLKGSNMTKNDLLLIFSVGGGNEEKNVSTNLVNAINYAVAITTPIIGIVGRDGGHTAKYANGCVIIPTVNIETITPHSEAFQGIIWHLFVSHPELKQNSTKWESVK